ncbi:MAG: phosphoribosylformylglycinamidine cyclo-ligase [Rhodothermia bacterium]|nr:phosphoribosylformylglycinamidine cyclo-ligase [Rhodothermia bacterium]
MTTYREAGVDIDAGEELIRRIKPIVGETFTPAVLTDIGAFGAFYELDLESYRRPVLVSSVDGVGTKLKIAHAVGRHDSVGQDLVNHCVNDIAVCGADPLYFLDYFATGKLIPDIGEQVVRGFASACRENGCALVGGETAEMPGLYEGTEYDLAGTVVGIVEKDEILDGLATKEGDLLIGLPSTGLHTNGYSLARRVLRDMPFDSTPERLGGSTIADALLMIHRSYLAPIRAVRRLQGVRGIAHITGGGMEGNITRVVRRPLIPRIAYDSWPRHPIFDLVQDVGRVPEDDMRRTFNLGIGLVIVVDEEGADTVMRALQDAGESPRVVGDVATE